MAIDCNIFHVRDIWLHRGDETSVTENTFSPPLASQLHDSDVALSVFDAEAHYSPIVENNLFRPLGWRRNRPTERYRIVGIIIPTAGGVEPKALIEKAGEHQTYIVTPGQKLNPDTEVIDIQSKQVTLSTNGTHRTLQLPSAF